MVEYNQRLLSPLLEGTPLSASILDIGCGMGFALLALKRMGFVNLYGIERDMSQYEFSLKNGLQVILTDDTKKYLGDYPQNYDVVLLFDVLEHIPVGDQINFLRAIYSTLRPGGKLILQVPNACSPFGLYYRYIDYTHYSSFTSISLCFVCLNAGFDAVSIDSGRPARSLVQRGLTFLRSFSFQKLSQWFRRYFFHRYWRKNFMAEFGYSSEQMKQYSFVFTPNILAIAAKKESSLGIAERTV
jgi:SAM-dependent methyltransferase